MLCKCGCGTAINTGKTWVSGHNTRHRIKERVTKICKICSKEFSGRPSYMANRVICSIKCRNKNNSGENNPSYKKTINKCPICKSEFIATPKQIERGKCCSMECGRKSRSRKISDSRRKSITLGKNAARRRDEFKCRICSFDFVTAVHHIIPKNKGGTDDISNLITLCPNHHYMAHANLYEIEYLKSLIPVYDFVIDLTKPNKPARQPNRVNFRGAQ